MRGTAALTHADTVKVVNYATYTPADERIMALRPAHLEYMARLHADGLLVAHGPFTDGSGALFVYETPTLAVAKELMAADPYQISGVFESCRCCPWEIVKANPTLMTPS
jgi:hypothetical protein